MTMKTLRLDDTALWCTSAHCKMHINSEPHHADVLVKFSCCATRDQWCNSRLDVHERQFMVWYTHSSPGGCGNIGAMVSTTTPI